MQLLFGFHVILPFVSETPVAITAVPDFSSNSAPLNPTPAVVVSSSPHFSLTFFADHFRVFVMVKVSPVLVTALT